MSRSSGRRPGWALPLTLLIGLAMVLAAGLYVFDTLASAPRAAVEEGRKVLADLKRVAEAFRSGSVTTSFVSYATQATGVNRLQVAELQQLELFEQTDEATVLWGQLALPDLVVRARAPVEYGYYVDLEAEWEFQLDGNRIRVYAPELQFTRPSVDVSEIEFEVAQDSLLRDSEGALERLRTGLTQMSLRRAKDHIPLIRELARRETEKFVTLWLAARFVDGDDFTVEVTFPSDRLSLESGSGRS